ncbi:MAG: tetratricopeptide repeat protein [Anaerolineales bacterium]|nr:tetratricopeptide repeat protein [Anaerolineales bacterium]
MLTLKLTLDNKQVIVYANEAQSHSFSLHDLMLNAAELNTFVQNPRPYGSRLFQALFKDGSAAKTAFDELSKQTARTIVLVLDSPELDGVAWEYAYNERKQEYVVEDCAFMRALPEIERPANGRLKESVERVSLLFIPANPLVDLNAEPMRALDVDGEWREMTRHITANHAPFDLLQLRPVTPEQLQTSMARYHDGLAVHFSGHGAAMKDGTILLFERENGASNPLGAQEFIRAVKDKAGIVFLSACQSAAAEKTEFGNLARGLVKSGVPFALGMQFNLPDPFAPVISGQFYNWLAQGHAIPEATMQARRAVKRENEFFVGMIALYAAHPDETGKINWRGNGASLVQTVRPADVSDLPSPASGLIGRQRELMRIGTQLIEGKRPLTVTLHGAGGIGKTALLWQSLLRFAPSFDLTLALALDPLPSLESILGRIERFLGLPSPCANETKERESMVRERLTSKRTLLGLDNFETLNYALNEKDSDEEKTSKSLHTLFENLAANGVTLCVTSREVTNLPGETIEDIQGLTNENGGRLFQENVVRQKDEIYIEKTQQVSEMVGGHPLALRLLASAFDDQVGTSLDQYIEDLQSYLPKARDKWTEENRHESLRASFDFTMNNLVRTEEGKELQIALSRLSVFIAFFVDFTAAPVLENRFSESEEEIVQMQLKTNTKLLALWERGLLDRNVIESPNENHYLYRLHPALGVFAKEHLVDAVITKEIYWKSLANLARIAEEQINKSILVAQISLHAIPDFLIAAELKNDKDAALMQFKISKLLRQFGSYDDSWRLLEKSLYTNQTLNNQQGKSVVLHAMAYILRARGRLDEAMRLYQQSLKIKEEIGDIQGKSDTIYEMASIYVTRGDLEMAMHLYQQSLDIREDFNDIYGKSATLHQMAGIYIIRGDFGRAMKLYRQSLEIAEQINDLSAKSSILHGMAYINMSRGDLDEALYLYQQSLDLVEGLGDLKGKSDTLHGLAYVYVARNDLNEAMLLYQQSLEIFEGLGDLKGKAETLHEMAGIYFACGDSDRAMQFYLQALEIHEHLGNLKDKAVTIGEIGSIYLFLKNLDKAIEMFEQKLFITKQLGDQHENAIAHINLGIAFFQKNRFNEALSAILSGLDDFQNLGAKLEIEQSIGWIQDIQQTLGLKVFMQLWKQVTGDDKLPKWLSNSPQE